MENLNVAGQAPDQSQFNQEISKRYPYANLSGDYAAPEWTKPLLIQKYSLQEVGECLRFLNRQKLHENQIPAEIEDDIEIERLDDYEIDILKRQWNDQKKVLQKIDLIDETGKSIGVFEVPQDLSIRTFKSYFLNTRYKNKQINEVFFFDFNKINELKIKDLIQKNGMSNQIHVSFNPLKFNLYVNDNFNKVQIKLNYLQTDFTLKHLSHMIAEHLIANKKNADGHSKPEDISSEIWFMNSLNELLYCTQTIKDEQRKIEETLKSLQQKKINDYEAQETIQKQQKIIQKRSELNQLTLKELGISRYFDQLMYSYPSSCNNGWFYVDFRFCKGKDLRFQIGKSEISFQELSSTVIQNHQRFENIDICRFNNQESKQFQKKDIIKAKDVIFVNNFDSAESAEAHIEDTGNDDLMQSGVFPTITISVNIPKINIKDKQIKLLDHSNLNDLQMKIQQLLNLPIMYHNQFQCRVSGNIIEHNIALKNQMQKQNNIYIMDVDIRTIIYLNIMSQNELNLEFDENTTVLDLILELKPEDFGGIQFDNFEDAMKNRTLVTHNHILVDYDVIISQKFKIGDRLFIQLKINFDKNIEFLVYDKTMALDMLFNLVSIQNDNDSKQIQKVLQELNGVLSKCNKHELLQTLYNSDNESSFKFLRSLIKTYTDDSFYRVIGSIYRNGNFHQLKNYTYSILNLQLIHGYELRYQKKEQLYRGVNQKYINIDDYKPNSVHYWPTLTSTTKDLQTAHNFSGFFQKQPCTLFEIYTNQENKPATNIQLASDWSYWNEKEVLLLPFFQFQVIDIKKNKDFNYETIIRIVELPYQNLLQPRQVSYCRAIWIDEFVYNKENSKYKIQFENKFKDTEFVCSSTVEQGIEYINNTVKAVVIISGRMGQVLVPRVNHMENLKGIIVFCGNLKFHKGWSSSYAKVKNVVDSFEHALQASDQILRDAYQNNHY